MSRSPSPAHDTPAKNPSVDEYPTQDLKGAHSNVPVDVDDTNAYLRAADQRAQKIRRYLTTITGTNNLHILLTDTIDTADVRPYGGGYLVRITTTPLPQPATDLDRDVFDSAAQHGLALHEAGHVLYTDFNAFVTALDESTSSDHDTIQEYGQEIFNGFEDGAIEQLIRENFSETAAKRLAVVNHNLRQHRLESAPPERRQNMRATDAVQTAILDICVADSGVTDHLLDDANDEWQFAGPDHEQLFTALLPVIRETYIKTLTAPDAETRTEHIAQCWEIIEATLFGTASPDEQQAQGSQSGDKSDSEADQHDGRDERDGDGQDDHQDSSPTTGGGTSDDAAGDNQSTDDAHSAGDSAGADETGADGAQPDESNKTAGEQAPNSATDTADSSETAGDSTPADLQLDPADADTPDEFDAPRANTADLEELAAQDPPDELDATDTSPELDEDDLTDTAEAGTETETASSKPDDRRETDSDATPDAESPADTDGEATPDAADTGEEDTDTNADPAADTDPDAESGPDDVTQAESEAVTSTTGDDADTTSEPDGNDPTSETQSVGQTSLSEFTGGNSDPDSEPDAGPQSHDNDIEAEADADTPDADVDGEDTAAGASDGETEAAQNAGAETPADSQGDATTPGGERETQSDAARPDSPQPTPPRPESDDLPEDLAETEEGHLSSERSEARQEAEREARARERVETVVDQLDFDPEVLPTPPASASPARFGPLKREVRPLKQALQNRLDNTAKDDIQRGTTSGRLQSGLLYNLAVNNPNVMGQRRPGDNKDYRFVLILDRSSSMGGEDIKRAEDAVVQAALALDACGVDVCIIDFYQNGIRILKPFEQPIEECKSRLLTGATSGRTPLGKALAFATEQLELYREPGHIIAITDDDPTDESRYREVLASCPYKVHGALINLGRGTPPNPSRADQLYDSHTCIGAKSALLEELVQLGYRLAVS